MEALDLKAMNVKTVKTWLFMSERSILMLKQAKKMKKLRSKMMQHCEQPKQDREEKEGHQEHPLDVGVLEW